jgi:hypothetical protein
MENAVILFLFFFFYHICWDPEIQQRLRSVIVANHLKKLTKRSNYEKSTATIAAQIKQVEKQQEIAREKHHHAPLEHIKAAGESISHAFSNIFHRHDQPKASDHSQADAQAHAQSPAQVSPVTKIAAVIVDEAVREDAERYADDIIRKIQQGNLNLLDPF